MTVDVPAAPAEGRSFWQRALPWWHVVLILDMVATAGLATFDDLGGRYWLVDRMRQPPAESLTARETEVLRLVADGLSNGQIGQQLRIAEATVKTHLLRVYAKLEVDDRTRAVTVAIARGLIPVPSA